jgi:hypothetical protein
MSTIVTRSGKGSPLSHVEVDANFTNLNTDKIQSGNTVAALTVTSATINGGAINGTTIGATTASTGKFSDLTDTGLTSGRVIYATTGGNLTDDADMTFDGTKLTLANDASISGLTVGKGGGAVASTTVVGNGAMVATNTGVFNSAFGNLASALNTSGTENTSVGAYALYSNTTGSYNTAVGKQALATNVSGGSNTALGTEALISSTGSFNTALGRGALTGNTSASNNTAVGYQAAYTNTTGDSLVAVGRNSLRLNTTGYNNTAVGDTSLRQNTTGIYNSAFGSNALDANTTGARNTVIGTEALYLNTTASNNTAVGYQAGYSVVTGSYNTFIGNQAGYLAAPTGTALNVAVGHQAGYNLTGTANTLLGNGSGSAITSGTKNSILGSYNGNTGGLDIRTASNYIVLSDGDGNPRGIFDGSGNFCIGTTTSSPGGRLTVITGSDEAVWTKTSAGASSANMISWNSADSGNNYFHGFNVNTAGDAIGSIDYNRAGGLVRYNTTSDATLKNIIGDSNGQRSLEILNTTRIREFAWKSDAEQKTQIGVIAQELYETYKGAVSVGGENDKGEYRPWGVDKTAFTFHLIAGWQAHEKLIQEQQEVITTLTARITALENK